MNSFAALVKKGREPLRRLRTAGDESLNIEQRFLVALTVITIVAAVLTVDCFWEYHQQHVDLYDADGTVVGVLAAGDAAPAFEPGPGVQIFCGWEAHGQVLRPGDTVPTGCHALYPLAVRATVLADNGALILEARPGDTPAVPLHGTVRLPDEDCESIVFTADFLRQLGPAGLCFTLGDTSFGLSPAAVASCRELASETFSFAVELCEGRISRISPQADLDGGSLLLPTAALPNGGFVAVTDDRGLHPFYGAGT